MQRQLKVVFSTGQAKADGAIGPGTMYWHPIRNLVISTTCSYFECVQPIQPILSSVVYNFILSKRAPGPRSIKLILFQIMIYLCI